MSVPDPSPETVAVLRPMHEADLPAVMAIERASYEFPWTLGVMGDCLKAAGYYATVCVQDSEIVGYGIFCLGVGEAHILNVCTAPRRRRQGIGRRLLTHLLHQARCLQAELALLEVRPSNTAALALYRACGFREIGRRPGYYPHALGREDALLLARPLTEELG